MIDVRETPDFTNWLATVNDQRARLQIVRRISRVAAGNFGDAKSVGGPVSELRIDHGPGYRLYYTRRGKTVVILLCGGGKRTQSKDIRKEGNRSGVGGLRMKVSKLKKFDAAEHLRTPEARAEYLNIVLTDGDPTEVRDALNLVARAQGMSEIAKAAGVTREGLYKTLGENGNPEFATVLRIIGAMGIRLTAEPAKPKPKRKAGA
jgi:putative addiction module killer protein/probable addiction module antidote protein